MPNNILICRGCKQTECVCEQGSENENKTDTSAGVVRRPANSEAVAPEFERVWDEVR